ncbi:M17 family metallopeptidase [Spiroplasma turonicum]|uniref:Probable cytosol aminopeptidase n=1 Tax=Spiroplasma turonicum TaxID=216946 RepID=A0A0K1P8Q3_9MOLU|nr:M17 family metallopeptidase [Spiroplasma turonicum]AKU80277.1 leucyl aminopeptidase [Spiroplasma turonicum]ALX71278.1 leucyl aminopeptidase [Spiroplasma turonicum]
MITINDKSLGLTLKAVGPEDKLNELVIKEHGSTTLIESEKTIYFFIKDKCCVKGLVKVLIPFFKTNKYDLNIDVDSFLNLFSEKEMAFKAVVETLYFETHKQYTMKKEDCKCKNYNFMFNEKYNDLFNESSNKMEFQNFARDLQDLPPNIGTSVELAERIKEKAKGIENLKVTVYDKKQIEEMKMGLLLSVNAGSYVEPRVVVLEYTGDSNQKKVALVGKGITFDSGGYNLKPSNYLDDMKFDMSGAAITLSTVMALAKAKAKCNVVAVGMFTDNRIGGHATLTESVITSMNGMTVEINNTDAEGRLVLADGITYAVRNQKAEKVITVATLTGAIVVALGKWFTGVFTKSDEFFTEFEKAAKKALEPVWRQPLICDHLEAMKCSKIADLTNSEPGREAGSSTAAAFLDSFAEGKEYLHLDIAATADSEHRGKAPMLKSMFELLK